MQAAIQTTITLLKLRIGMAIALSALAGMAVADGSIPASKALIFALAVLGASGAAGGFNHYYERDSDRLMRRTRSRPFASGALKPGWIWPLTFLALLGASLFMAWSVSGTLAAALVFFGAFTYGIVYTVWLKRRNAWNVVIGGLAGSFAIMAGAVAVDPTLFQPVPIILATVMFLWTPPHFWSLAAARGKDYIEAGVPMLPVVEPEKVWTAAILSHAVTLAILSMVPVFYGMGMMYAVCAALGGGLFAWRSWQLYRAPGPAMAMTNFRASLIQFCLLATGVFLDKVSTWFV